LTSGAELGDSSKQRVQSAVSKTRSETQTADRVRKRGLLAATRPRGRPLPVRRGRRRRAASPSPRDAPCAPCCDTAAHRSQEDRHRSRSRALAAACVSRRSLRCTAPQADLERRVRARELLHPLSTRAASCAPVIHHESSTRPRAVPDRPWRTTPPRARSRAIRTSCARERRSAANVAPIRRSRILRERRGSSCGSRRVLRTRPLRGSPTLASIASTTSADPRREHLGHRRSALSSSERIASNFS